MIGSFADQDAQGIYDGVHSRRHATLQRIIERKLLAIEAAIALQELRVPQGNKLEALKGNRAGQHSIRINQQLRICFRWEGKYAYQIEIVDYH